MKLATAARTAPPMFLALLLLVSLAAAVHPAAAYSPKQGDGFSYSESIKVSNGEGSYTGYTDQTTVTGTEQVVSAGGSSVLSHYSYNYYFSNNQGNTTSSSKSGGFTWSDSSYTYVNGTDNQVGYSQPIYVWFAMNPSTPQGGTFYALNTQLDVISKNYTFPLQANGTRYVRTIETEGTGQYQRNDDYGLFAAKYTWYAYFDPTTGFVVGYNYTEADTGTYQGQPGSFDYTDTLSVTSTSYPLTAAPAPPVPSSNLLAQYLPVIIALVTALLLVVLLAVVLRRRRRQKPLPAHSPPPTPPSVPPPPASWESKVDLGSKPAEQVVIREVAKTNCRFCGTLIPTTVDHCPYCGAPRQ